MATAVPARAAHSRGRDLVRAPAADITYTFADGQARAVGSYSIFSANDRPERDPSHWLLEGSNDGAGWTQLDEQQNVTFDERFQQKVFLLPERMRQRDI